MNKPKKIRNLNELDNIKEGELFEWNGIFEDDYGNTVNFIKQQEIADKEIESKKESRVNFRWNTKEIERCKKIASVKGLPYQTYIKSTLKIIMDKDEKELGLT